MGGCWVRDAQRLDIAALVRCGTHARPPLCATSLTCLCHVCTCVPVSPPSPGVTTFSGVQTVPLSVRCADNVRHVQSTESSHKVHSIQCRYCASRTAEPQSPQHPVQILCVTYSRATKFTASSADTVRHVQSNHKVHSIQCRHCASRTVEPQSSQHPVQILCVTYSRATKFTASSADTVRHVQDTRTARSKGHACSTQYRKRVQQAGHETRAARST